MVQLRQTPQGEHNYVKRRKEIVEQEQEQYDEMCMKNKLSSIEAYWGNISEPERTARGIRNAAAQIAHKRSLRANLNERVKNMGGRMVVGR